MNNPATPENELTNKQKVFCSEYTSNGWNATQAAIKAGYSENTAYSQGQRLLKKVEIAKYLDEYMDSILGSRKGLTVDTINEIKKYAFMSDDKMELLGVRPSDKKGYLELLGKYLTLFTEKKEVEHTTLGEDGKPTGISITFTRKEQSNTN